MAARAYSLVFLLFLTTWLSGCNDQDDAAKAASDVAQSQTTSQTATTASPAPAAAEVSANSTDTAASTASTPTSAEVPADQVQPAVAEGDAEQGKALQQPVLDMVAVKKKYADVPFKVLDIGQGSYKGSLAASVILSAPADLTQDLSKWLTLSRADGKAVDGGWIADDSGTRLYFPYLEPETQYHIRVNEGLPSALGASLKITDRVVASQQADITTPSLQKSLSFASQGNFLAHRLTKGLPITAVNVSDVEVDFYRLEDNDLPWFLSSYGNSNRLYGWDAESVLKRTPRVYSGRFDLQLPANTRGTRYIPISNVPALQGNGVYLAILREVGFYGEKFTSTWFAVTDLGVHVRLYDKTMTVSVASLASADPVAGVQLQMLDGDGNSLWSGEADKDGIASVPATELKSGKARLLLAHKDGDTTLVKLYGPALDLSEFDIQGRPQQAQSLFLYSPRDLYRPGETVPISALLRDGDGKAVPGVVLQSELRQPDGRVVRTERLQPGVLNYYEASFAIAKDAPTGDWSVSVTLPDHSRQDYTFKVEDFLPERMTLAMEGPQQILAHESFSLQLDGRYLYGAPANGNRVQTQLVAKRSAHPFANLQDFYFGDVNDTSFERREDLDDVLLDDQGKGTLELSSFWDRLGSPLQLRLYESLLDSGGRPVTRRFISEVLPAPQLVGIRPQFRDDETDSDSDAHFELVLTDGEKKLAASGLTATLIREERNYHWTYSEADGWSSDYTVRQYPVTSQTISVEADKTATLAMPVEWGYYRLEVTNPATKLVSSYRFLAGWMQDDNALAGRPDRIGLALDKKAYKVGDTIKLKVQPPAPGKGFVTVESDKQLYRQAVSVPAEGAVVEIPVDAAWDGHHDLYINMTLVQPGSERVEKLPRRMMGIQYLPLDREERHLQVSLQAPEKALPETTVTVPVTLTSSGSLPKTARVTLAAVDMGVLNISDFKTPDPFGWFFAQRRYAIDSRDSYGDLIEGEDGDFAKLQFGGDGDLNRGGSEPPSDVQIVSLFSGLVDVDAEGKAQVPLTLPDFNGRVRLMAVAFGDDAYGSAEQEMQVAAPLVTQLTKPRFLASGDQAEIVLDLHNLSGVTQKASIDVSTENGLSFTDQPDPLHWQKQVELAVNQKLSLHIPVTAGQEFGLIPIRAAISGLHDLPEGARDQFVRETSLRVRPAWAPSRLSWQQAIHPGQAFQLPQSAAAALIPSSIKGSLSLSSLPPLNVSEYLQALKAYPYGCLEQTTSGVFPQLYINDDLLARMGIAGDDAQTRKQALEMAIQRLFGMQQSSGGFGLWNSDSPEEYWLTVYVTDFLMRAREAGFAIPAKNLQDALSRLNDYVRSPDMINSYYMDEQERSRFAVQAYAGQVLARTGQAPLSELRNLYDNQRQNAAPLPLLQLGLALAKSGDAPRSQQAIRQALADFAKQPKESRGYAYYADYGSPIRDRALALYWLVEAGQPAEQWQPLLFDLSSRLKQREWFSTQESNALFLAGSAVMRSEGKAMSLMLSHGDSSESLDQTSVQMPADAELVGQGMEVLNQGSADAYLNLTLLGYEQHLPKAINKGLQVQRSLFSADGVPLQQAGGADNGTITLKTGDMVLVRLDVQSDESAHHVMVVDLLPAGLELENQNLATSVALADVMVEGSKISEVMQYQDIRHQEYRDDRYVAAVEMSSRRAQLYYLARAVSPGTYTLAPTYAEVMYDPQVRHQGGRQPQLVVKGR